MIEPALTPDEWETVRQWREDPETWGDFNSGPLTALSIAYTDGAFPAGRLHDPFTPHQAIALINAALPDDDPRKITHAMLADLLDAIDCLEENPDCGPIDAAYSSPKRYAQVDRLNALRDIIAALLPPTP